MSPLSLSLSPQAIHPRLECMERWGGHFGDDWCADCTERERERESVCVWASSKVHNTLGTETWTNCQCIYYITRHTSSPRQWHYWNKREDGSSPATIVQVSPHSR
jgi:hypothetical protein